MVERTYWRDLTYHLFHRQASIGRFIPEVAASAVAMQDVDCLEYCYFCNRPLALIEVKKGRPRKCFTTPLESLAQAAGLPAYLVFYDVACNPNPAYAGEAGLDGGPVRDIDGLAVQKLPAGVVRHYDPRQYADWLLKLHLRCPCAASRQFHLYLKEQEDSHHAS